MTRRSKILLSICVLTISLLCPAVAAAQTYGLHRRHNPAQRAAEDTIPLFRGIAVGVDVVGPAMRLIGDYGQYEAMLRLNLKDRYYPIIEAGYGSADHEDDVTGIRYKTSAPYGRIGVDFNVLKDKHDKYRLLVGARYSFTSFKYDTGPLQVEDPLTHESTEWAAEGVKCSYGWLEVAAGVDATIIGPLHLGWSVRYRSRLHQSHGDVGEPWYVPGFGKRGNTRLGAVFNVFIEL